MRAGPVLALLFAASALWGQAAPAGISPVDSLAEASPLTVDGQPERRIPIRKPTSLTALQGAPYSGETRNETTLVRPDGTRITQIAIPRREFRDSMGRTRREQWFPPDRKDGVQLIVIDDPTAKVEYVLESGKRIAHRFSLSGSEALPPAAPPASVKTETLGSEVIQGVPAEGVRRIVSIPAGPLPAGGSRAARDVVIETWTASDLRVVLREHTSDPLRGETTLTMANLHAAEPAAALFQVPPDYRIVDEARDFAIAFTTQSPVTPPEAISRVGAKYTEEARRAGIHGTVLLAVTIDRNGRVRDVQVERSLHPGLDEEAVKAVRQWKFRPGEQDGRPVRVNAHVEITFSLFN